MTNTQSNPNDLMTQFSTLIVIPRSPVSTGLRGIYKEIKGWRRDKKDKLINSVNPAWRDLSSDIGLTVDPSLRARDDTHVSDTSLRQEAGFGMTDRGKLKMTYHITMNGGMAHFSESREIFGQQKGDIFRDINRPIFTLFDETDITRDVMAIGNGDVLATSDNFGTGTAKNREMIFINDIIWFT